MKLVFATNNKHKFTEVKDLITSNILLLSLSDIGCTTDLPETQNTLEGNASQKANYVYEHFGYDCFADDTGLEIEALGGEPGVFSARYAGEKKDAEANMNKVLDRMKNVNDRNASFRTVIALNINNNVNLFEGNVEGSILTSHKGNQGFGYDPIFQPKGYNLSFAEMTLTEKNKISHRRRAFDALVNYLNNQYSK